MRILDAIRRVASCFPLDRVLPAMFVLSLGVLCFIGGAYLAEFETPWYQTWLEPSFRGLRAMTEQQQMLEEKRSIDWDLARDDKTGVTNHRTDRAYDGLTMYVSFGETPGARLISMDGEVVHKWNLPFRKAWPDAPHITNPPPEERIHWHTARLLPNGDLIANYVTAADTPYGYGLVKMDKASQVIWRYSDCAHHDFDIDEEGQVYALRHWIRPDKLEGAPHLSTPVLQDFVVVLSPEGEEIQRIAIDEAFAKSKFRNYLESIVVDRRGDHTHSNGIAVISKDFADKHDFCEPGDLLLSIRNPGWLAILNLEREEIVWASCGIWKGQHDPDPLENGNILLFDNNGNQGLGGKSRILEWNPANGAVEWEYCGTEEEPFESVSRGCQQLLPNGNILITESNKGRILEVTRDQEVVWEFNNPHRYEKDSKYVAVVCSAQRYAASKLKFLNSSGLGRTKASDSTASADNRTKELK